MEPGAISVFLRPYVVAPKRLAVIPSYVDRIYVEIVQFFRSPIKNKFDLACKFCWIIIGPDLGDWITRSEPMPVRIAKQNLRIFKCPETELVLKVGYDPILF